MEKQPHDVAALQMRAERITPDRLRFEAMGFKFKWIRVSDNLDMIRLDAEFVCACGRYERFGKYITKECMELLPESLIAEEFDPAQQIIRCGATSPDHLREDGYTEEEIDEIQKRGGEDADTRMWRKEIQRRSAAEAGTGRPAEDQEDHLFDPRSGRWGGHAGR